MRKKGIISYPQQVVSNIHPISQPWMSPLPLRIVRLGMYETGLKCLCIFYNMKNHDLTFRIPPEVNTCQADSWRIKMRPCLFLPIVQFLPSFKPITQAPPPLLGSRLEVLKLIMSGWKWETTAVRARIWCLWLVSTELKACLQAVQLRGFADT